MYESYPQLDKKNRGYKVELGHCDVRGLADDSKVWQTLPKPPDIAVRWFFGYRVIRNKSLFHGAPRQRPQKSFCSVIRYINVIKKRATNTL